MTITKASSGQVKRLAKLSICVKLWQELGSALHGHDKVPESLVTKLQQYNTPSAHPKVKQPVLAKDGWIYVFKKHRYGPVLTQEVQVIESGGTQKYKVVSWAKADRDKWISTYPRTTLSKEHEKFLLDVDLDCYVLYSRIQLPFRRVGYYLKYPDKLAARSVLVSASTAGEGSKPVEVVLVDFVKLATEFQNDYMKSLDDYEKVLSDTREAKIRYQADIIWSLAQQRGSIKRWFRFDEIEKYREDQSKKIEKVARAKEDACGRKCSWMLTDGFIEMRDDYNGDVDIEKTIQKCEASLLDGNLQSEKGLEYLERVAGDDESWYYRYFFAEEPLQVWRKSIDANEKVPLVLLEHFLLGRIAKLIPKTKPKAKVVMRTSTEVIQTKIVEELSQILARRNLIVVPELKAGKNGKLFWVAPASEYVQTTVIRYELTTVTVSRPEIVVDTTRSAQAQKRIHELEKWKEGVEKAGYATKKILLIVELINFISSAKAFADAKGSYNNAVAGVNLAGAVCDSLSASKFLVEKVVAEETTTRVGTKAFARVSVIGSICDYFVGVAETYKNFMDNKPGLALGYATTALAATALGAAAALEMTGGVAAIGLSATWWTGIGAILFVAGTILIYIFTDEPLEAWAKTSYWGEKFSSGEAKRQGEGDLNKQIAGLHELLSKFEVQCHMYATQGQEHWGSDPMTGQFRAWRDTTYHGFRLRITPGLFDAVKSRFIVSLKIEHLQGGFHGWETIVDVKNLVLPDAKTEKLVDPDSGTIRRIDRPFTKKDLHLIDDFYKGQFRYNYSVRLDFAGDGNVMYPQKGPEEDDGDICLADRNGMPQNISYDN